MTANILDFKKPVILPDLPEDDYHAQKGADGPLFSYSRARTIIKKSPYHAYLEHPLLGGKKDEPTAAMDRGSLFHKLLLGDGPSIVVVDAADFRTNRAKEARDAAQSAGNIPVLSPEYRIITEHAMPRILDQIHDQAPEFFDDRKKTEVSIRWNLFGETPSQCRIDAVILETGRTFDLKTTTDASESAVTKKIYDMGYDIQFAMYPDALNRAFREMVGRFELDFIFIEPVEPFMVSVVRPDSMYQGIGESRAKRAAAIWNRCLATGEWPGYGRRMVSPPAWALSREEAESDE